MQSIWERVKNKGSVGWQCTIQPGDERPTEVSIFHSLSSSVTQYITFTFYIVNKLHQQWKGKWKKKKKANAKLLRESHLYKAKCFCNCVGDLVV